MVQDNVPTAWRQRRPSSGWRPGQLWTGTNPSDAAAAEEALLAAFVKTPHQLGRVMLDLHHIGVPAGHYMTTLDINADATGTPIVLTHGAGAGLGFGYRNFDTLASLGGEPRRVLAVDWLGQANSSRPSFPPELRPAWTRSDTDLVDLTIRFFVEALEAWRAALGIERFDLIGHSMGGYFSAFYAMAYPHRVRKLVLSGAAGVGHRPPPEKVRPFPMRSFKLLWNLRFVHFELLGAFGRLLRGSTRRGFINYFPSDSMEEAELLFEYFWALQTAHKGSTDVATNMILKPLATDDALYGATMYARRPVAAEPPEKLDALRKRIPTTLVYGEHDWLFTESVHDFVRDLGAPAKLHFVSGAAHHMYAENREEYHEIILHALRGK